MIRGRFGDTSGAPHVEGVLRLPNLAISANVSFLADTGAEMTTLMPMTGQSMGIDYSQFVYPTEVFDMGGAARSLRDNAILTFWDPDRRTLWAYQFIINIMAPNPALARAPSLLGRDILDRWRVVCDKPRDKVTFTVRSADASKRI